MSDNPYLFRAKKHSQIRDGNRSMSDNPYLFRAKKHSEKELSIINKQNILMNILELSEQEIGRRESLQQLREH